ncbi:tetratricopeptide repeat protein [Atopomonas sediminilitoris]|uniref:tetratricopeptide repeat protein n=1 Tax=Atopomonas sediminilitoris TaxID=2919919 RepID=UPI001F4D991B|nr:HEAT repeat domain-containing protein [Atopomonas sediminilitoris]MCJ8168926.1 HEAT repeat domain-containing protein [Atopomonas sediminilitoris]
MSTKWLFINAFWLESASWLSLSPGLELWQAFTAFLFSHGLASLCLSIGLWQVLPKHYKQPLPWSPLFIFSLAFFIPAIGVIGVSLAVFPALYFPRKKLAQIWAATPIPELPFRPSAPDAKQGFSAGGLHDVLRHAINPNKRLSAILSTRRMSSRDAIPILKLALKDPVDDVRLLAYSMLDSQETAINLKIKTTLGLLETSGEKQIPSLQASLGQHYWELAYLGLAQGSVLDHVLASARQHVERAIELRHEASDQFLLGRINLLQGRLEEARDAFSRASEEGFEPAQLAPYLAETAFMQRNFAGIASALKLIPEEERHRLPFSPLTRYWQC